LRSELRRDASIIWLLTDRLANRRIAAPLRTILEEVENGDRKVMVGRSNPRFCDDAVPIMIGVTGEGDVEAILESDQASHRVRR